VGGGENIGSGIHGLRLEVMWGGSGRGLEGPASSLDASSRARRHPDLLRRCCG